MGLPYVDVKGRLTVPARFGAKGGIGGPLGLTGATPFWPVDDARIQKGVAEVRKVEDAGARLRTLLARVHAGVKYGGAMGTRDGVLEVLERGYGRCWDKSDVLVTLCRAAGLPTRQVGGWVPPIGAGHIWTEVHLDGGWLPVDPTTPWLGASAEYIPFFATETGRMPIVYPRMPEIRRSE